MVMIYDPEALGLTVHRESGLWEVIVNCPFHDDSHPSASFNMLKGIFFCFACGEAANAQKIAKFLFTHVAKREASKTFSATYAEPITSQEWRQLLTAPIALDNGYLESRGVTEEQIIDHSIREFSWGVGIPIPDADKYKFSGFLIRRYANKPRYLFFGSKPALVTNHASEASFSRVFVVEGFFGILAAERADVKALCTLGVAISPDIKAWLPTIFADTKIVAMFDNDFPGYLAAARFLSYVPTAKVVVPGQEADELPVKAWTALANGKMVTTDDYGVLRRMSRNPERFTKLLNI